MEIIHRIKWLLIIIAIALILNLFKFPNTLRLLGYKIILICVGVVLAHIIRKTLFPYIDIKILLLKNKENELPDAIKFAGISILIGLLMYAIILGLTSGI